jgi:hypothetical protein
MSITTTDGIATDGMMTTNSEDVTTPRHGSMTDLRWPHDRVMNRRHRRPVNGRSNKPMVKRLASHRVLAGRQPGRVCRGKRQ